MTRKVWFILASLVLVGVFFGSLGVESAYAKPAGKVQQFLVFGGGGAKGSPRIIVTGVANLLNKYAGMSVSVTQVHGKEKFPLMGQNDIQMVAISAVTVEWAWRGKKGNARTKLRDLATGGGFAVNLPSIIVRKDAGAKTFSDLRGQRVDAAAPAVTFLVEFQKALLKANNMTKSDIRFVDVAKSSQSIKHVIEGRTVGAVMSFGNRYLQINRTVPAFPLQLTTVEQNAVIEAMPVFHKTTIPKGFYEVEQPWSTVADNFHLWTTPHVNNVTAYTIMKTLFENIDEFHKFHRVTKGFNLKTALDGFGHVPMHPGAIAYYKEKGMWTKAHDTKQKELIEQEKAGFGGS